jgi:hypothetical protein
VPVQCRAPLGPLSSSFARSRSISIPFGCPSFSASVNDEVILRNVTVKDISVLVERSMRLHNVVARFEELLGGLEFMNRPSWRRNDQTGEYSVVE